MDGRQSWDSPSHSQTLRAGLILAWADTALLSFSGDRLHRGGTWRSPVCSYVGCGPAIFCVGVSVSTEQSRLLQLYPALIKISWKSVSPCWGWLTKPGLLLAKPGSKREPCPNWSPWKVCFWTHGGRILTSSFRPLRYAFQHCLSPLLLFC